MKNWKFGGLCGADGVMMVVPDGSEALLPPGGRRAQKGPAWPTIR
jgi:hypothetical protein